MVGTRLLIRLIDNHQMPSASGPKKRHLWQRGDVITVNADGMSFGNKVEGQRHPHFVIINIPGELPAQFANLTAGHPSGESRRTEQLNLTALRAQMTTEEKDDFDTLQEVTLSMNGKAQIDAHTGNRPF